MSADEEYSEDDYSGTAEDEDEETTSKTQDAPGKEYDSGGAGFGWNPAPDDSPTVEPDREEGQDPAESPPARPASPPIPSQQPSLADGIVADDRPQTAPANPSRRPSTANIPIRETSQVDLETHGHNISEVYGRPPPSPASPTLSHILYGSHSSAPRRRHPNGLPLRHSTGPLPGMPYVSDLASRYPIREAPPSRPEISLISGQLYVGGRLRSIMSAHQHGLDQPQPQHSGMLSYGPLWAEARRPSFRSPNLGSSFLEQRRAEKERRAMLAAAATTQPLQYLAPTAQAGGPYTVRAWASYPGAEAAGANGGGAGAGAGTSSRERARRESVERWLEEQTRPSAGAGDARPASRGDGSTSSSTQDPSLTYTQFGIFRTYGGGPSSGMRPSSSLPVLSRGGARRGGGHGGHGGHGFDPQRKRPSTGAAGTSSPRRASGSPRGSPSRGQVPQSAWY